MQTGLVSYRHQVNQREHKHPNQVNEVPVQAVDFDIFGGKLSAAVANRDDPQVNDADHYVCHVQTGDSEEYGAKQWRTLGIPRDREVFLRDHVKPFGKVQSGK